MTDEDPLADIAQYDAHFLLYVPIAFKGTNFYILCKVDADNLHKIKVV